jgi:putative ABC transport system permease protein
MVALLTLILGRMPIGWLQLSHNRGRLAVALGGVVFANVLIFMQLGFMGALIESIRMPYAIMNADLLITASDANTLLDGGPLPRARMYEALGVPGVASATAVHHGRLDWKQPDGTVRGLDVFGIDPSSHAFSQPGIEAAADRLTEADTAVIDRRTRKVDPAIFDAIDAGDPASFEANRRTLRLVGTFSLGGGFAADGYMVVSDQTFLRLFASRAAGAPNLIFVRAAPGADVLALKAAVGAAMSDQDSKVRTIPEAQADEQSFQTTQKPVGIVFGFGVVMGALVGVVIVYQVLSTDVADHMREYATFKAIGYDGRFFLGVVFEEAALLALLGFIPGVWLSMGLYHLVRLGAELPVEMTAPRALGVLAATMAMCAVSGAIATRRLARADPADLF